MEITFKKDTIIFFTVNSRRYKAKIVGYDKSNHTVQLYLFNINKVVTFRTKKSDANRPLGAENGSKSEISDQTTIKSPLSGKVIKIYVHESTKSTIPANTPLVTIESMKMENEIRAPFDLFIKSIHINEGDLVQKDEVLLEIERITRGNK